MATDRGTKAALAAEGEFAKFLDELNQYEFMKVYDGDGQNPDEHDPGATITVLQPLGNYDLDEDDSTDGASSLQTADSVDCMVSEVDIGQSCLACEDKCTGFKPHEWRNACAVCKCPRELHDIYNENFVNVRDRLGWHRDDDPATQVTKEHTLRQGYSWVPPGLTSDQIEEYMEQLPNHKMPKLGSPGEKYRDIQLIYQLPKQDLSSDFCRMLETSTEVKEFRVFRELRDNIAMDIGVVKPAHFTTSCFTCSGVIETGDLIVIAAKLSPEVCFHPACFLCSTCEELLVDLTYCQQSRKLYCERHYAELIRPRCPACDELIFSSEYTKAMENNYHKDHLACKNCDKKLIACRYILKEEHPYCIPCYQELFAHNCEECKKPIGPDYKDLSYKEHHWHEFCFKCFECQKTLVDQPFAPKNEKIFCAECHDNNFAARCDACQSPFRGGMKKFEYRGKQMHEECFTCMVCSQPIGNKSFIPRDEAACCVPCYEQQFASKCTKCSGVMMKGGVTYNTVINKGGVSYKNMPWHRECFTCNNCSKELAKEKFTSKDEKPYCTDCYGDLFAKKCCKCSNAITGFGGTKFISFEERHWHSDCFNCYKCNASMVGKGFLMNELDIVCPDCGRS